LEGNRELDAEVPLLEQEQSVTSIPLSLRELFQSCGRQDLAAQWKSDEDVVIESSADLSSKSEGKRILRGYVELDVQSVCLLVEVGRTGQGETIDPDGGTTHVLSISGTPTVEQSDDSPRFPPNEGDSVGVRWAFVTANCSSRYDQRRWHGFPEARNSEQCE
jgi:hypothetical protein